MEALNLAQIVEAEQTHLRLPSQPAWLEPTVDYLKHKAIACGICQESRASRLVVALHEALTNAMIHGNLEVPSTLKDRDDEAYMTLLAKRVADPHYNQRQVDIFVDYDGQRCQWSITDQGPGFDVEATLQQVANTPQPSEAVNGRGLILIRSFMDEVQFEAEGRRIILTLNKASGQEKRRQPRLPMQKKLRIVPVRPDGTIDWEAAYSAISRNISADGISLLQKQLAVSERVIIGIPTDTQPLYIPAEIKHWRTVDGNTVELGCRFHAEPTRDDPAEHEPSAEVLHAIGELMDKLHAPVLSNENRRAQPRVLYTARVQILAKTGAAPLIGYARDLSRDGIAFLTTALLPREVIITLADHSGEAPLRVRTEIIRCVKVQDDFYDVGGRFLRLAEAGTKAPSK